MLAGGATTWAHEYGLFDNSRLQAHLYKRARRTGPRLAAGQSSAGHHTATTSTVTTDDGAQWPARVVVNASGHKATLVRRPAQAAVAQQVAYGIVGSFSAPPWQQTDLY